MKLDEAKATAIGMTSRFGADFAVFRLSGWNAGEYSVLRTNEIPAGAEIAQVFTVSAATAPPRAAKAGQESLF